MSEEEVDQQAMADEWAAAMEEQSAADAAGDDDDFAESFSRVKEPVLAEDDDDLRGDINLNVILDIPVTIAMEIGRTRISIRNLLQLNQGSVVELDRIAGEPMDVLVNGTLVAHGEVVVVNEKFGIRLTDVISPAERIKNLR